MRFSCIMTTFDDGPILRQAVSSVLNQTFDDFELLLVDDGSGQETKDIIAEFDDPRLTVLPQANDGLSSARNRGLHHAKGTYVCFLDGDDVRAPWAFAAVDALMKEQDDPDLVMVQGVSSGERTPLGDFPDAEQFTSYESEAGENQPDELALKKAWAMAMEPQSANKFIAKDLIDRASLRFPNDHFFEDILFHAMCVSHARSIGFLDTPTFTYFQRSLRPQLTGGVSQTRFDILGTVRVCLQLFQMQPGFHDARQRGALMIGVLRLLQWCESRISAYHQFAFRVALRDAMRGLDPMYFVLPENTPDPRKERAFLQSYIREVIA